MRAPAIKSDTLIGSSSRRKFLVLGGTLLGASLVDCSGGGTFVSAPSSPLPSATAPSATPVPTGPSISASVVITRNQTTGSVGSTMVGLSYEKMKISGNTFTSANVALISLFSKLGPSVLRIGGNSVDHTVFTPGGVGGLAGQVAPSDINGLAAFLTATGWRVIYGINLATSTPALAAAEAIVVASALGNALHSFEIGNEPDGYASNGLRPSTYTEADFVVEWASFAAAIRQALPTAPLSGPAAGYQVTDYTIPFAASEGSMLNLLTEHYYVGNGKSSSATMADLLGANTYLQKLGGEMQGAAASNNIAGGYRFAECNSFYGGGSEGVSNAFGSALWAIDFLLQSSQLGASGLNFHGGGNGTYNPYYTPIADVDGTVTEVRPLFYGMLFASKISAGPMYNVAVTTSLLLTAYAIAGSDGATYLAIVNKDPSTAAATTVSLGAVASQASVLNLSGTGLTATTGTTLGGSVIGTDGSWNPAPNQSFQIHGESCAISVPAATAVLLKIT